VPWGCRKPTAWRSHRSRCWQRFGSRGASASGLRGGVGQLGPGGWQGEVLPCVQVSASCARGSAGSATEGDEYTAAARGG
jgi:hypothetical protein